MARMMYGIRDVPPVVEAGAELWRAAFDGSEHRSVMIDGGGRIRAVNRAWSQAAAEHSLRDAVGTSYLAVCDAAAELDPSAGQVAAGLREVLAGSRNSFSCVYPCHAPAAEAWFDLEATAANTRDGAWALIVHRDVSAPLLAQRRAHEQETLLTAVGAAVIATDLQGVVTQWSARAAAMYGWTADEVLGRPITSLTVGPEDEESAQQIMAEIFETGGWEGEFTVRRRDGARFQVHVCDRLLLDDEGRPRGVVGVSLDLSRRVQIEDQLRSARDFLAAVTNRMGDGLYVLDTDGRPTFMNKTAEALLGWRHDELADSVMHDRIHAVRQEGGPRTAADCPITQARGDGGTVRVDDDVFQRRDGSLLPVEYSSSPITFETGEQGQVVVFTDITERKAREAQMQLELDELSCLERIREALDEDRMILYAQPVIDLASGEAEAHELLVRMVTREDEVLAPAAFLPAAERSGLIRLIDRRVLERAMVIAAAGHRVAVNVSAASLGDPMVLGFVRDLLQEHGADPEHLVFELTETAVIADEAAAKRFVTGMRELGCSVALDDFGTGYGSFHYLKHFPVSVLKVDREFVRDLAGTGREANTHVIKAVVSLAQGMGKRTVAEGVEDEETLSLLRELGVDAVQGYLYGRPAPALDVLPVPRSEPSP
jgi:PAS domain S-box-containing protein